MHRIFWLRVYCTFLLCFALSGLAYPVMANSGLLEGVVTPAPTPTSVYPFTIPGPIPNSVTVAKQITPEQFTAGDTTYVRLTLRGEGGTGCFGIPGKPVDAMIVFDISTSAGMGVGSNWEKTAGITKALFANLAQPIYVNPTTPAGNSQVGIVSSRTGTLGPEPVLLQSMTTDYELLSSQVDRLTPSGDTDLAAGLDLAGAELKKISTSNRAQAIFLMLHDNVALSEGTRAALNRLDTQKIAVYIVVNSLNIPAGQQISESASNELAVKKIYYDPQPSELRELFLLASDGNPNQAAGAIQVSETVSPSGQARFSNITGNGTAQGDQVVWYIQSVENGNQIEIGYDLNFLSTATGNIQILNDVKWLDCNGYPQSLALNPSSSEVQVPTLSVDTQSTPAVSTQAPIQLTPVPPLSGRELPWADQDIGIPLLRLLPWLPDWLWLLILLLLLLLFFLLLYWLLSKNRKKTKQVKPPTLRSASSSVSSGKLPSKEVDGNYVFTDIDIRSVLDKQGKKLKQHISWIPNHQDIRKSFSEGKKAQINVWLNEELPGHSDREIYRMTATLIMETKRNNLTGNTDIKKIGNLQIQTYELADSRNLLNLVFQEVKNQSMQLGVQELVVENVPDDLKSQFQDIGFERGEDSKIFIKIL